jgi:hypothetical protein
VTRNSLFTVPYIYCLNQNDRQVARLLPAFSGSGRLGGRVQERVACQIRATVVFTIPKMLRILFKYNRRLLGDLCRLALRSLTCYFEVLAGSELMPGVIAAIQTFGGRINVHPHLHFLVTEGGVDETGIFRKIPRIDDSRLAEIFAREVLGYLVHQELLSPEWADRLLSWSHTGSNIHSHKFIARVTSHIPDKGQVTVRYYGLYANAHLSSLSSQTMLWWTASSTTSS